MAINELPYAWEKLSTAIYSLVGLQPIKERLHTAWMSFHTLNLGRFDDPELEAAFQAIMAKLTVVRSDPGKGHVPATLEKMTDDDAVEVAREIVDLAHEVARRLWAGKR